MKPKIPMTNTAKNTNYDLEERTLRFSNSVIDFARSIPRNIITNPLISQFVRAGTSIGANYCEADEASSKRDFINKIAIAKKETKETKYWIRTIVHAAPELKENAEPLWQEAQEFNLIFAAIVRNTKNN